MDELEKFHLELLRNATLRESLLGCENPQTFTDLVVRTGAEHGYAFTRDEVTAAIDANRRAWFERWVS